MKYITFVFALAILFNCSSKRLVEVPGGIKITLRLDNNKQLKINSYSDSAFFKTWSYKDSTVEDSLGITYGPTYHIRIDFEEEVIIMNQKERRMVFNWTKKLIENPISPQNFCTGYVGNLYIEIEYGHQIKQSCEYSSICEWNTLTKETKKIDAFLKTKIKNTN